MKTKLKTIVVLAIAGLSFFCEGYIYSESTSKKPKPITLTRNNKGTSMRPGSPSRQIIESVYIGEELSFSFAYPEGECTLTITEDASGFMTTHTFDSSDCSAEVYVGNIGPATLELKTELGQTYTGHLD